MSQFHPKPFGKYFLIEKLATGGMAEIYKAKTFGVDGFEKLLAIKRILPHCSADKEFITMLIDEAKLSVLLSHTNIVQVYDLGKVGEDYFISMEFIHGFNMREVLSRLKDSKEKIPEALAVYIISEVCKGLDYAHAKQDNEYKALNIVHRDVSPQNILVSFEGEVKIVDFGIAKAAMNISNTMAGILKGKISYMSPEQALGKPIDRRTDIFSSGLMFYELLTGEKLFRGETQFEVLKNIRTTHLNEDSFSKEISEPLRKILAKALAYSLKDRYENAGDFQIDLTRYLYTTYADFTPRKLAKLMRKLFGEEIANSAARESKESITEPKTQSMLLNPQDQTNIVHGQNHDQTLIKPTVTPAKPGETTDPSLAARYEATGTQNVEGTPVKTILPPSEESVLLKAKKTYRRWIYPLLGLAMVGAGVWGYLKTDLFRPIDKPKITGVLQIASAPEGAQILINDGETNLLTPATISNLEVGKSQKITLKKARHKDWTKTITLLDANPISLRPTLEVIPVGSIRVKTTPPNAKIYLDGKDTQKKTPAVLEDLPLSQTYSLKLELEKHRPIEDKITVYSIDPIEFNQKLEEILYGSLQITSVPAGAKILLNNNDTGLKTPTTLKELEVGKRFNILLKRSGYQNVLRSIEIKNQSPLKISEKLSKTPTNIPNTLIQDKLKEAQQKIKDLENQRNQNLNKTPEPITPTGSAFVSVTSNPRGADIFIDGVRRGSSSGRFKVAANTPVEVMIRKSGRNTFTRILTLRPGETRDLGTISLKASQGRGIVLIDSNPPGAMVLLNGKAQKRTPLRIKGLRPGVSYNFTVQKKGYQSWSRSITASEGSSTFLANLKKL